MKSHLGLKGNLARLLTLSALVVGVLGLTQPAQAASIENTKHNLGTNGTGSNHLDASGTTEICVFCHTPHAADVTTAGAPLWNKRLATGATYTMYVPTDSLDGEQISAIAGVSLPCLSCHDGTQAMDNIINAPGSQGYTANGGTADGLSGALWTWEGPRVTAEGKMTGVAAIGLGADSLKNDHPIGIQYCGGGLSYGGGTTVTGTCNDGDFTAPTAADIGTAQRMWVETGGAGRQKTDLFLFERTFTTAGAGPSVECASCHDVHSETATFLRIANTSSNLCLTCHTK